MRLTPVLSKLSAVFHCIQDLKRVHQILMTENNWLKILKRVSKCVKLEQLEQYRFEQVTVLTILHNFSKKSWNKNRLNFHDKFTFVWECEADESGSSRRFYSGNFDDLCQPITEAFPVSKIDILSVRLEKWVYKTVSIRYYRKLRFIKLFSYSTYFSNSLI